MKVKIEFEVELPDVTHTFDELEDFLRYEFRDNGSLSGGNPFYKAKIYVAPIFGTFEISED